MEKIYLREDYIKLGQALKAAGIAGSGSDARIMIENGDVYVNGEKEFQRGKKLREGDVVKIGDEEIFICR